MQNGCLQDFKRLNLSRYRHGGVNVTGFQLLDAPHPNVTAIRGQLQNSASVHAMQVSSNKNQLDKA